MATTKQRQAARQNIKKAIRTARAERTITKLPKAVRTDLSRQAAKGRARGGKPGHNLEDRNRTQVYQVAKKMKIPGRSSMGKWDLIDAIRKAS
jgi:hypothetical protein